MDATEPPPDWVIALGRALRRRRQAKSPKMTTYDVAEKFGVTANAVTQWELAKRLIPLDTLVAYSRALGYEHPVAIITDAFEGEPLQSRAQQGNFDSSMRDLLEQLTEMLENRPPERGGSPPKGKKPGRKGQRRRGRPSR